MKALITQKKKNAKPTRASRPPGATIIRWRLRSGPWRRKFGCLPILLWSPLDPEQPNSARWCVPPLSRLFSLPNQGCVGQKHLPIHGLPRRVVSGWPKRAGRVQRIQLFRRGTYLLIKRWGLRMSISSLTMRRFKHINRSLPSQ